jgi:acyl-CoA thioesterase FadM
VHEDEYTIVEDMTAPLVGPGEEAHHLVDYVTQEMVSTLWTKYLANVRAELPPTPVVQAMRRVTYSLDSEAFAGQPLQRGIRVVGRTRRSLTFNSALWHKDTGAMVHDAELVTVFIEPGKGSVPIPDDFAAVVEKFEGRSIPITERPG